MKRKEEKRVSVCVCLYQKRVSEKKSAHIKVNATVKH